MVRRPAWRGATIAFGLMLGWAAAGEAADWEAAGGGLFVVSRLDPDPPTRTAVPDRIREATFSAEASAAAAGQGLDPRLLRALVAVESAGRPGTVSPAGAAGLTQLMPATARELGVADVFDPAQNLAGGATYLARQIRRFGDLRLALAAYNAGPDQVARLGRMPAIPQTRAYVDAVVDCYLALAIGRNVTSLRDCRPAEPPP